MDFGKLLDDWERRSAQPGGLDAASEAEQRARTEEASRRAHIDARRESERKKREAARYTMEAWIDAHGVPDKDEVGGAGGGTSVAAAGEESRRLRDLRPGARIDLHGKTVAEAELALGSFLEGAARGGIEKVLVITGKGNHSADGPVLGKAMRSFLEANPRSGRFGQADRADGGTGALWVLVRPLISRGR
ncbi:MAG: Smr/MutS family protein [Spirochaetota bacterium]